MNQTRPIIEQLYPEIGAGGFSRIDGTVAFYSRVNALLESDMVVVDFGAGRGAGVLDDPIKYRRALRSLKGKVKKVIGLDVDPAIMTNPSLDEAFIIEPGSPLPIDDESIDLVLSDYTFEHIDSPEKVVQELLRILKPGGWICARTPNKWGYISIGARLIPNNFHGKALRKLQPERKGEDIFTTNYKMNSSRTIRRLFRETNFEHFIYSWNPEPAYFGKSKLLAWLMKSVFEIIPEAFGSTLLIFLRKRGSEQQESFR